MQPARIYDVGFTSKSKSTSRRPEILIIIPEEQWQKFKNILQERVEDTKESAAVYLSNAKNTSFVFPEEGQYGYGACCNVVSTSEARTLHFKVQRSQRFHVVATLCITLIALNMLFHKASLEDAKKKQYLEIETLRLSGPNGHAIYGHAFPVFGKWLQEKGKEKARLLPVRKAMQEVWVAASSRDLRRYSNECSIDILEDGRFCLRCFGDACDVAIYPEDAKGRDLQLSLTPFSAHNLDGAVQQLALLAGLVALVGCARSDNPQL